MSNNELYDGGPSVHEHLTDEIMVGVELVIADPGLIVVGAEDVIIKPDELLISPDIVLAR